VVRDLKKTNLKSVGAREKIGCGDRKDVAEIDAAWASSENGEWTITKLGNNLGMSATAGE
jgi:hypothetical protein